MITTNSRRRSGNLFLGPRPARLALPPLAPPARPAFDAFGLPRMEAAMQLPSGGKGLLLAPAKARPALDPHGIPWGQNAMASRIVYTDADACCDDCARGSCGCGGACTGACTFGSHPSGPTTTTRRGADAAYAGESLTCSDLSLCKLDNSVHDCGDIPAHDERADIWDPPHWEYLWSLNIVDKDGAMTPAEYDFLARAWNTLGHNGDLAAWAACMVGTSDPGCTFRKLSSPGLGLFDRVRLTLQYEQAENGCENGGNALGVWPLDQIWVCMLPGRRFSNLFSTYQTGDREGRECAVLLLAALLAHEFIHVCGDAFDDVPCECERSYLAHNLIIYALRERYSHAFSSTCCEYISELIPCTFNKWGSEAYSCGVRDTNSCSGFGGPRGGGPPTLPRLAYPTLDDWSRTFWEVLDTPVLIVDGATVGGW